MADVALLAIFAAVLVGFAQARSTPIKPKILVGGPRPKILHPQTISTRRTTMSEPAATPFNHATECKMQDAKPEWYPIGNGHYERVCACGKEISYPPVWRRPDILDPKVMQHEAYCEIADKPELLKHAVKVKHESTYDFATCGSCSRNWVGPDSGRCRLTW